MTLQNPRHALQNFVAVERSETTVRAAF